VAPASCRTIELHTISTHRPRYVFHTLFADEFERQAQLSLQLVIGRAGNEQSARLAQLFEAGSDIDAVAQQVVALDHDIAEIDPHAKQDSPGRRNIRLILDNALLHGNGTGYGIDDRAEFDDDTVAHQLDDTSVVFAQQRINHIASQGLDRDKRILLVRLDEARITDDIGGENSNETPLRMICRHGTASSNTAC